MKFAGRVGLVTGASRGIGRATAIALARGGADVGINFRSHVDEAEEVAEEAAAVEAEEAEPDAEAEEGDAEEAEAAEEGEDVEE